MRKIVIRTAFHPECPRVYRGEHIYKVIQVRGPEQGYATHHYGLDNGAWVKELAPGKYVTNWTNEEHWGRVEEVEVDEQGNETVLDVLGFMILRISRTNGLL